MRILLFVSFVAILLGLNAQRYRAVKSSVRFFSEAPLENIEALNVKASSVLDLSNGNIVFSVPINEFEFEKSLMEEHFNENYLESDKYPKSLLIGSYNPIMLTEGENEVVVTGSFELHGVQNDISVTGKMTKREDQIIAEAIFYVLLADYDIKIPRAVFYNIAEEIEVTVSFTYEKI